MLWSLRYKPLVGDALLDELARSHSSVSAANMGLLARCFGWDDVHDGVDPDRLASIQSRGHRRWAAETGNAAELSALLEQEGSLRLGRVTLARCLRYLSQPWHARRSLWQAQLPEHIIEVNALLDALERGGQEPLPAAWDRQQVQFWRSLADVSRPNRWRCQVNALRGGLLAALTLAIAGGSTLMSLAQRDLRTAARARHRRRAARGPARPGRRSVGPCPLGAAPADAGSAPFALGMATGVASAADRPRQPDPGPWPGPAAGRYVAAVPWPCSGDGTLDPARGWPGIPAAQLIGPGIGMFVPEVGCALVLLLWTTWFLRDRCRRLSIDLPPPASGNTV